jgi:hypothetical protein
MKHKKKVVPLAAAAVVHGLCPTETGKHEHIPNEKAVDFYGLAENSAMMGTTTAVSGLPLVDLANPSSVFKRPRAARRSKRSRR